MDNTQLRNYAHYMFDFDTGTIVGQAQYFEWIENLVLNPKELQKTLKSIKEMESWG